MRTSVATPRGAEPSATPSCSASRSRLGSPTPGRSSTYTAKLGFHRPLISAGTTGGFHARGRSTSEMHLRSVIDLYRALDDVLERRVLSREGHAKLQGATLKLTLSDDALDLPADPGSSGRVRARRPHRSCRSQTFVF